jgi:hypothetical protein
MNNNTNHNFTDLLEQDSIQPNHSHDAYMTICEDCYEEAVAFETKFSKVLGTVKI